MRKQSLLVMVLILAVAGLGVWLGKLRAEAIRERPLLQIHFDHHEHAAVRCATCHHNFLDGTGKTACYFCHKQDPELGSRIEKDFHMFCRSCHVDLAQRGFQTGPVRRCAGCHVESAGAGAIPGAAQ
ncbi:MAG: cytochrome c3 family protein [Gammaproteobacteria bacterium]|nr:cytochrome c3 family protein [Gammaproteobacteria bacterium]